MPNKARNPNDKRKYDLQQRTARFGGAIVEPARTFPQDPINNPLISQIVRAATDIGADYMGADGAESKKDFQHKISIRKKESKEIKRWLRMIAQGARAQFDILFNSSAQKVVITPKDFNFNCWADSIYHFDFVICVLFVIWSLIFGIHLGFGF